MAGSLLSQKMSTFSGDLSSVKWEKSAHTFHFFHNEHPGMTENRAPTRPGGRGGGVDDETAAKHTFLNTTRPAICVKSGSFLLDMLTGLSGAAGHRR